MARADDLPITASGAAALAALPPPTLVVAVIARDQGAAVVDLLDAAVTALDKHLAADHAAVLVLEAGVHAPTGEAVRAWCAAGDGGPVRVALAPHAPLGGGAALRALLAACHGTGAAGCAVLDAELAGVPAVSLAALLEPVARGGADAVLPAYTRPASEGTLTSNLLAPLTRALYGRDVQQLAGGGVALAGALAGELAVGTPPPPADGPGVEIWLTTSLVTSSARLVQAHLGRRPAARAAAGDVPTILAGTVGPTFALMEAHHALWEAGPAPAPVPMLGEMPAFLPAAATPDVAPLVRAFRLGLKDLLPVWEQVMPEPTLAELYPLALLDADEFQFPAARWARVVADFAVSYHERRVPADHLLRALTPLYLGRVASFLLAARRRPAGAVAGMLEELARAFEAERAALAPRWH